MWHGIEPNLLYLGLAAMGSHLVAMAFIRQNRRANQYDLLLIGLAAANLLFWFLSAPDMRFGRGFFWIWMGIAGSLLTSRSFIWPSVAYATAGLVTIYSLHAMSVRLMPRSVPIWGPLGKARAKPTRETVIDNGQIPPLVVFVPESGDQCGDSSIPSTPYPLNTLRSRSPGFIRSGFMSRTREDEEAYGHKQGEQQGGADAPPPER